MTVNLDLQLTRFREKVKTDPDKIKIVHRQGYSGGGGVFGLAEGLLFLLSLVIFKRKPNKRA
jgi:rhombotail lipoprotein